MSSFNHEIPVSFRRAARRAVWLRWGLRIGGPLLAALLVATVVSLLLVPRLVRRRTREHLQSAGVDSTFAISRLNHRGIVFQNLNFGRAPGDLQIAELEASFSIGDLRRGRIREVRIRGMSGEAGLQGARWTFGGLERLAWLARNPQFAKSSADHSLVVEKIVVESGLLNLRLPGLPAMSLPFTLSANLDSDGLYAFTAVLSPDNQPLPLSGEMNPFSGNGRIAAQTRAMQLDAWARYRLVEHSWPWHVEEFAAKTDLHVSTLFERFALVWAHVDCEMAGIESAFTTLPSPRRLSPDAPPQATRRRATAHSARLTLDILADDRSPKPRIQGNLAIKQGRIAQDRTAGHPPDEQIDFTELTTTFGIRWDTRGRPRFVADGECGNPSLTTPAFAWQSERATFEIPECLSLDSLRWQAAVEHPTGEIGEARVAAASATLSGSSSDVKFETDSLSFTGNRLAGNASLAVVWTPGGKPGLAGVGGLLTLDHAGETLIDKRHDFSFSSPDRERLVVDLPQLASPCLPGATGSDITLTIGRDNGSLTYEIQGKAEFPAGWRLAAGTVAAQSANRVNLTFSGAGTLGKASDNLEAVVLLARQNLAMTGDGWNASGQAEGRLVAKRDGLRDTATITLALADLNLTAGQQSIECKTLAFDNLQLADAERRRLTAFLANPRWLAELTVDGRISAGGLDARSGLSVLEGVALDGAFAWTGKNGFVTTPTTRAHPISIDIAKIKLGAVEFFPRAVKASLEERKLTVETTFNDRNSALEGTLFGSFSIGEKAAGLVRLNARSKAVETIEWLPSIIPFPELRELKIGGGFELETSLFLDPVGVAGTGRLRLHGFSVSSPAGGFALQGLDTDLSFRELFPPATEPNQWLTFGSARGAGLVFGEGGVAFQLPTDGGVFVERAAVQWCDGRLATHAVMINPERQALEVDMRADDLSLGQVLATQNVVAGNATGTFQGQVPLRIHNGTITSERFALFSTPGRGGRLQLIDPQAFLHLVDAPTPYSQEIVDMLKDMIYTSWRLDFVGGKAPQLAFRIDGFAAGDKRQSPMRLATTRQLPSNDILEIIDFISRR